MFIDRYFNAQHGTVSFTRSQGSDFAKQVADDFNPLHDEDAKRFCIPGDLLFAVVLSHYGLSRHMEFTFSGMVVDGVDLVMPQPGASLSIDDTEGRHYLSVERQGEVTTDSTLIEELVRNYVEFSGHTFPDILVPLLQDQGLMINPARPMVIYESMIIDLDSLKISAPRLEIGRNEFTTDGKRGNVKLKFNFVDGGEVVGRGEKHMVLGGLREYDAPSMDQAVLEYRQRKMEFSQG